MNARLILFISTLFMMWGCSLHRPNRIEMKEPLPDSYRQGAEEGLNITIETAWWKAFEDEHLNRLMEDVFRQNLSLEQALHRIDQMEQLAGQSKSRRLPQLGLKMSKTRGKTLGTSMGESGFEVVSRIGETRNSSLSASFEVDIWNKLKSRQEASVLEFVAAQRDVESIVLSLSAQVADTYYSLVERKQQLKLAEKTVEARRQSMALVEARYREGLVTALDVYQANQTLAISQSRIPQLERDIALASHALSILKGEYPGVEVSGTMENLPSLEQWFPNGVPSDLLVNRPDIQAELMRLEARDLEIGIAMAERFPSINLLADYRRSSSDSSFSLTGTVWNLIGNLTMPLVDWGGRKAEVKRTESVFEERLAHYRLTVLNAFREVEDAVVSQQKTSESLEFLNREVEASEAALRLAKDQYFDGLTSYLTVLSAEAFTFDAQTRLLSSRRQLIANRISLARSLGGRWMGSYATQIDQEDR